MRPRLVLRTIEEAAVRGSSNLLERFRRTAGVPAAASDEPASELVPLFAVLDEIEAEAEQLRAAARERAARVLAAADAEVEQIHARARRQAEVERVRTERERRSAGANDARAALAAAEEEARRLRERGLARVPAVVDRVLAELLGAAP